MVQRAECEIKQENYDQKKARTRLNSHNLISEGILY